MNDQLVFAGAALPAALNIAVLLALFGLPLLILASEIVAVRRSLVFYKKLAQQLTPLCWICMAYVVAVAGGAVGMAVYRIPEIAEMLPAPSPLLPVLGASFGLFVLLLAVHGATWKQQKNMKALHLGLGCLVSLTALATFVLLCMNASLAVSHPVQPENILDVQVMLAEARLFLLAPSPLFWPLVTFLAVAAAAFAGVLGALHVLSRRAKDDFGRDYYSTALRWTAGYGQATHALYLLCAAWPAALLWKAMPQLFERMDIRIALGCAAGFGLLALLAQVPVLRAESPLRAKWGIVLAAVLTWLSFAGIIHACLAGLLL